MKTKENIKQIIKEYYKNHPLMCFLKDDFNRFLKIIKDKRNYSSFHDFEMYNLQFIDDAIENADREELQKLIQLALQNVKNDRDGKWGELLTKIFFHKLKTKKEIETLTKEIYKVLPDAIKVDKSGAWSIFARNFLDEYGYKDKVIKDSIKLMEAASTVSRFTFYWVKIAHMLFRYIDRFKNIDIVDAIVRSCLNAAPIDDEQYWYEIAMQLLIQHKDHPSVIKNKDLLKRISIGEY